MNFVALIALFALSVFCLLVWPVETTICSHGENESAIAIARAEVVNMAIASYVQANGSVEASSEWSLLETAQSRYSVLVPFLPFAPEQLAEYMPFGYFVNIPPEVVPLSRAQLIGPEGAMSY